MKKKVFLALLAVFLLFGVTTVKAVTQNDSNAFGVEGNKVIIKVDDQEFEASLDGTDGKVGPVGNLPSVVETGPIVSFTVAKGTGVSNGNYIVDLGLVVDDVNNERRVEVVLNSVKFEVSDNDLIVTIPAEAKIYVEGRGATTKFAAALENLGEDGPVVASAGSEVSFNFTNLRKKIETKAPQADPIVEAVQTEGQYVYTILVKSPIPIGYLNEDGTITSFPSYPIGTGSGYYGENLAKIGVAKYIVTQLTGTCYALYGAFGVDKDALDEVGELPTENPAPAGGGGAVGPRPVASGTTVGPGETGSVPEGEAISDVTVKEGGTVTVPETSGLESPTISGTVENKGTIKGTEEKPAVIEETGIVKGGTLEGVIENKGTIKGTEENPVLLKAGEVSITVQEGADIEGIMKIETPSGIHTLNIPPEAAFPAGVEITPQDLLSYAEEHGWFASLSIPQIPSEYQLVGGLIVSPEGFKITEPATIIIPYDKTKIPSGFTKDDLLVLAVDPDSIDWVSVEVKEVTEDTVTIETDILSTYAVVVPVAVEYPTLKLYIRDLVDPSNKENVYHFTENVYDTRGTPHIYVNTIKTGTGKVDIYAKCTYPDGKSAWLYFDADGLVRFHDECAAEWSNITFDELTDYILIHGAWWFDKSKEAEWKLSMPTGEYTWKVIVVKHGGDIEKTEDIICESEAKLILEY